MLKNITILYVEDELDIRENTKRPLEYLCDDLIMASNGFDGLELYKKYKPDIVISDIKMPKINGIEMCKAIKEIDQNQHIIFTTAHNESGYFIEAIDMQVDGYILKPIDYNLLENKIKNITNQIDIAHKLHQQDVLIKEIAKLQDNILVVLNQKQDVIFSNDNFLDFFNISNLLEFKKHYTKLDHLFLPGDDFFTPDSSSENWVQDIQALDSCKRVVLVKNPKRLQKQAFILSIKNIVETSHTIVIFTEITSITKETKELKNKVFLDELTTIYNRSYFNKVLSECVKKYKNDHQLFSVIMLDIDNFKNFNDTYGHQIGDKILKDLAFIIKQNTRETDVFARWGGEEFVQILPHTGIDGAMKVAQSLRKMIQKHVFVNNLRLTCSFGIAEFQSDDNQDSVVKRADEALYLAKRNGKNQVQIKIN